MFSANVRAPRAGIDERIIAVVTFALAVAVHLTAMPLTLWEYDEPLFAMAVEKYEPLIHHPPPPGYPIYIAAAKLLRAVTGRAPFETLRDLSVASTILGFLLALAAYRAIAGRLRTGASGAFLLYFSPALLVHSTLPQSDSGAMALLSLSLWLSASAIKRPETTATAGAAEPTSAMPALMALACAVCIGWRVQFAIAVVPLFLTTVVLLRGWRHRLMALQVFTIACLAWLIPMVMATGGVDGFLKWLGGQAAYFASHDADLSRSGMSLALIFNRFLAHPWGPKWSSGVVLLLSAVGFLWALRSRNRTMIPAAAMAAVYLLFALRMMDPADAVRYALPALPAVALFAAAGLTWVRDLSRGMVFDWGVLLLYAIGAYVYVGPMLRQRADTPSPPVAAIRYLRETAPRSAAILFDLPLKPHAEYLLRGFTRARFEEGLLRFGHRTDVPIFELTNGVSQSPHARVFQWDADDAYRKLTRKYYSATSVEAIPAERRFQPVSGVWPPERALGQAWRWVGDRGVILLPDLGAAAVRLTFLLPLDYPLEQNTIRVEAEGTERRSIALQRGQRGEVIVPIPRGRARLRIQADQMFVPAEFPERRSRDRRRLSVMLLGIEQVGLNAPASQPAVRATAR
ncbi:MAG TPA: hypothetical protein VFL80_05385 [Thermoanaerobaculia bacterium]|nr:hypothetical protein [Thermoanaerobaculia bacterium]